MPTSDAQLRHRRRPAPATFSSPRSRQRHGLDFFLLLLGCFV
jgi:hypothetical protein